MRPAWIDSETALRDRLVAPAQLAPESPSATLPPYLESFLAHVRLLVGVPFAYLVPDARLLPEESIRFFFLDRTWTDRLVDGALAVGKAGSREQAHHAGQHGAVQRRLDRTERAVRPLQRRTIGFADAARAVDADSREAEVVTGFLLRSAAVADWPHLEVRASQAGRNLTTLRLERLSPSVMLALFEGEPDLVLCEEPHHGVQFGVFGGGPAAPTILVRGADGRALASAAPEPLPMRAGGRRVVGVAELRRRLHARTAEGISSQSGSAALATQLLAPPWRQRFEGDGGGARPESHGGFGSIAVAVRVHDPDVRSALEELRP